MYCQNNVRSFCLASHRIASMPQQLATKKVPCDTVTTIIGALLLRKQSILYLFLSLSKRIQKNTTPISIFKIKQTRMPSLIKLYIVYENHSISEWMWERERNPIKFQLISLFVCRCVYIFTFNCFNFNVLVLLYCVGQ